MLRSLVGSEMCIRDRYIARAGKKGDNALEDLKKARWYLDRFIRKLEGNLSLIHI